LATESGKKRWEFRLSLAARPVFPLVCEDSVADMVSANAELAENFRDSGQVGQGTPL
jgi:hypothetical protein